MEASSKPPPLGSGRAFTTCLPPIVPNVMVASDTPSRNNKRHVTISQMTRSLAMGNNEDPNYYPTNIISSTSNNPTETQTKPLSQEEEEEEATRIKQLRGKEPMPSDGIGRGEELGKIKGVDSFSKRVWMKRLLGNGSERKLPEVVRVVEEEDVPSVATLALLGKALNGPGRRDVRKRRGCTVWNTD